MSRNSIRTVFLTVLAVLFVLGVLRIANIPLGFHRALTGKYKQYDRLAEIGKGDLPEALAQIARPSVVHITVKRRVRLSTQYPGFPDQVLVQEVQGSGVIVDATGYVLTNAHVVQAAHDIEVKLLDGREVSAQRIGVDTTSDVAVLRISARNLTPMRLADSDRLLVGEWVFAIGSPFGYEQSVTSGIVSGLARTMEQDFIQTDAAINQGNSGGALINLSGELVGINTAMYSEQGASVGIGFAIPSNVARKVTLDLIRYGTVRQGWLGVEMQNLDGHLAEALGAAGAEGVLVASVVRGSPAEKAGVRSGDLILRAGNREIQSPSDLYAKVAYSDPGESMHIELFRGGKKIDLHVKLEKRPAPK